MSNININVTSANRYRDGNPDFDDSYDNTAVSAALGAVGGALGGTAGAAVGAVVGAVGGYYADLKEMANYDMRYGQDNKPRK